MKALAIARVELRRLLRDRTNVFFLFIFPIVLILLIGASFGGDFTPKLAVIADDNGPLGRELVSELDADDAIEVVTVTDDASLRDEVERGVYEAGLVVGPGYTAALENGEIAEIDYLAKAGEFGAAVRSTVDAVIAGQSARIRAARLAEQRDGIPFEQAFEVATAISSQMDASEVVYRSAGEPSERSSEDRFGSGAATQLILFTFVNSLAGSAALIQTRQYGVLTRMLGTPTSPTSILTGQTLGRFSVAAVQGLFIILAAALLFGVQWGDPVGAAAILLLFSLVSTGAAMVFGSLLRTEQQAGALVPFGLAIAALGGSMVPLEVFPETMRKISRVTPHSWANEAFDRLRLHDASVLDVAGQLAVLLGFAVVLLGTGTLLLRRKLTT